MQYSAPSLGVNLSAGVQMSFVKQGSHWRVDDAVLAY
jgi:hypothetical protein